MRRVALPFAVACALAGPFAFAIVGEPDAPWHLALGRLILRTHAIPHTNALSWKFGATPWTDVSWLYDALVASLPQPVGVQVVTFALLAIALLTTALACVEAPWIVCAVALLLVPRVVPRPHVATWAALGCALWLGSRSFRARVVCVGLLAVFANLHPGAVFAGAVLAAYAAEEFLRTRRPRELVVALAALLSVCANPAAPAYLVENLHVQEVIRIREMEPPRVPEDLAFFVLAPIAIGIALWQRRWALLASSLALTVLGLRANREAYDAQLVFAPLLALGCARLPRPALGAAACGVLAFGTHRLDLDYRALTLGARWDDRALPVRAARLLTPGQLTFNGLRDGGWLAWAGIAPLVDGRIQAVPPEGWGELQDAERSREMFKTFLQKLGATQALTTRIKERLGGFGLLHGVSEWALIYWDDTSELYVRRDLLGARSEYRFFHPWGEIVGNVEKLAPQDLPALVAELDRFEQTSPGDRFALLVRCAAWARLRNAEAPQACASALLAGAPPALVEKAAALR